MCVVGSRGVDRKLVNIFGMFRICNRWDESRIRYFDGDIVHDLVRFCFDQARSIGPNSSIGCRGIGRGPQGLCSISGVDASILQSCGREVLKRRLWFVGNHLKFVFVILKRDAWNFGANLGEGCLFLF